MLEKESNEIQVLSFTENIVFSTGFRQPGVKAKIASTGCTLKM